ncbi:MAG TPA: hypothetical protein VHB79_28505 [Polyangiaceae bacterium]|nr:hypothetical protein [Polyangiaceae bacterium]
MPKCYFLTLCGGSSLDQHSNNVTLFNIVEQVNLQPNQDPPPGAYLPLEVHAYFLLGPGELSQPFDVRFALVAPTGLELLTDATSHKSTTPRYRTRSLGLPAPAVPGNYQLCVDIRQPGTEGFTRDSSTWPLVVARLEPRPAVVH